jgi:hypothetical protein
MDHGNMELWDEKTVRWNEWVVDDDDVAVVVAVIVVVTVVW